MSQQLSRRALLASVGGLALASGCGSLIPIRHPDASDEAHSGGDRVLLIGRIEIVPPVGAAEQKIRGARIGPDPYHQRAILFLAASPSTEREESGNYINPRLGDWFGFWVPHQQRHITDAYVVMDYQPLVTGRRRMRVAMSQILLPAPLSLDIQSQDAAVYIGSWRVWRDDFNSVTRIQANLELGEARAAARRLAGRDIPTRAAIPRNLAI